MRILERRRRDTWQTTHEIVPPEPHSTGNLGNGWAYLPRWLRVLLCVIAIAVLVLIAFVAR